MGDVERIRERFIEEAGAYDAIVTLVTERIKTRVREAGLPCRTAGRRKEVPSLVKKALLRGKTYEYIRDRAGVRVVYRFPTEREELARIIEREFVVLKCEDKSESLGVDRLRYRGIHYDVSLRDSDVAELGLPDTVEPICEIQLHTRSEDVWAEYSHELLYKTPLAPPQRIERAINRLIAMVEIFDEQVTAAREAVLSQEGYAVAAVLDRLERHFHRLLGRTYDGELSRVVLEAVLPLFDDVAEIATTAIDRFATDHADRLSELFDHYRNDDRAAPLIFQPEVFILLERLTAQPAKLEAAFSAVLPRELLADLATAWGSPLD